jgi:L-alanine-DL-glutamate epimerase-like enolase superfamily enzyme
MSLTLSVAVEHWPIAGTFTIARGSRTEAVVVVAEIVEGHLRGRGECVPYPRYGETVEGVADTLVGLRDKITAGLTRQDLAALLPAGAARNALDCALWDLEAKRAGVPAHVLAGFDRLSPVTTCFTLSLGEPDAMREAARAAAHRPILKVKLGAGDGDMERLAAVREGAPDADLVVDANEGWRPDQLERFLAGCAEHGVLMVEQPLPAASDGMLAGVFRPVPVCADESMHGLEGLDSVAERYDAVNLKLDKAGGLTGALDLAREASARGLGIMVGCMVGTSLAMAPAMLLTPFARFVDLDGPLLLAKDREPGLAYEGSVVRPPSPALWG